MFRVMREYVLIEGCTIICPESALLHCTELTYFSIFVHIQSINNLAFCLSVNVRSILADFRSDGAVMFITLMLGNDCCIFNITINKNPVAVFPLMGPARGSLLMRLTYRTQSFCGMKTEALLAHSDTGHEWPLHLPACPAWLVSISVFPQHSQPRPAQAKSFILDRNTQRLTLCDKANTRRSKTNLIKIKWLDDKVNV